MVATEPILTKWGIWLPPPSQAVAQYEHQLELTRRPNLLEPVLLLRVLGKIKLEGPFCCWCWQAYCHDGYGRVYDERKKTMVVAHRYVWEQLIGPISEATLDHRCRNRSCVWPFHLRPKSISENNYAKILDRYHIRQPLLDPSLNHPDL